MFICNNLDIFELKSPPTKQPTSSFTLLCCVSLPTGEQVVRKVETKDVNLKSDEEENVENDDHWKRAFECGRLRIFPIDDEVEQLRHLTADTDCTRQDA